MFNRLRLKKIIIKAESRPAFTLVEILVVLFVVSLGLVGILSLIVQNIQSQSYNKNNLIANHLAQEGIELIREVRDSNWRNQIPFNNNLAFITGLTVYYYMDYLDSQPHLYSSAPSQLVLNQDSNGFYVDSTRTGTPTIFSREIALKLVDANTLAVTSTVTWSDHGHNFSYDVETLLYNWQ